MAAAPTRRRTRPNRRSTSRAGSAATTHSVSADRSGRATDVAQRFARGDESAVRDVISLYGGAVHTVVRSYVAQPQLAAEAAQLTFVRAWSSSSNFDPERQLAPWLYCIARRTAIDVLRAERTPTEDPTNVDVADLAHDATSFDRTWEKFEVRRALDELPVAERDVVRLAHFVGLTHAQIAERLDVPVGTVKSRMSRAQRRLACALRHLRASDTTSGPSAAARRLQVAAAG